MFFHPCQTSFLETNGPESTPDRLFHSGSFYSAKAWWYRFVGLKNTKRVRSRLRTLLSENTQPSEARLKEKKQIPYSVSEKKKAFLEEGLAKIRAGFWEADDQGIARVDES